MDPSLFARRGGASIGQHLVRSLLKSVGPFDDKLHSMLSLRWYVTMGARHGSTEGQCPTDPSIERRNRRRDTADLVMAYSCGRSETGGTARYGTRFKQLCRNDHLDHGDDGLIGLAWSPHLPLFPCCLLVPNNQSKEASWIACNWFHRDARRRVEEVNSS